MNISQGDDFVSTYFTKLKVLWEELDSFNACCTYKLCICGGAKVEYTMTFLMGLNEKYAQIRGHILLMDLIPRVNLIFSLVIQEEHEREINISQIPNSLVAFNVESNNNKINCFYGNSRSLVT